MSPALKDQNIQTAIKQVEACGFECEAGPLGNNVGWKWLAKLAEGPRYPMGATVPHTIKGVVDGFELTRTVMLTIIGIKMSSGTAGRLWVYDLSRDPPDAYHYGSGVTAANVTEGDIAQSIAAQASATE